VVVVGGGDLALDAARVISRRARTGDDMSHAQEGAPRTTVEVVLDSTLEESTISASMIAGALKDGVAFHAGWRVERFVTDGERGKITGVLIARPGQRSRKLLHGDRIVLASPRAPALSGFGAELARDDRGFILVEQDTMRTSMSGVWAGGACVAGHRSIAHATADGKRAAWQIHSAMTGTPVRTSLSSAWVEVEHWDGERSDRAIDAKRTEPSAAHVAPPDSSLSGSASAALPALQEASRCFDCTVLPVIDDSCTTCGKCVSACPVAALSLSIARPQRLLFDQNLCYRCGVCVHECPEGAIAMVRAVWEERLVGVEGEGA
jgi:ferredoxin